jgi:hypothetical protein
MGLEQLSRWHWIIIGAIFGMVFGYAVALSGDSIDGVQSASQSDFERDVGFDDPASKLPLISGIVIHPKQYSTVTGGDADLVTYQRLMVDANGKNWWGDRYFVARIPFTPALRRGAPADPSMTFQKFMEGITKERPSVRYHYGWWLQPSNAVMTGAALGIVAVGLIWPTLLNLMLGAGLGRKHDDGFSGFSLWNYKPSRGTQSPKSRAIVTAADQARLEQVASSYERGLMATATAGGARAPGHAAAPAEVRKLNTQPTEEVKIQQPGEDDDIELKGQYYPVMIHHKKGEKKDGHGPETQKK